MTRSPHIAIIIPARYGSTRFPGKPLAMIGGRSMLARVADIANTAAAQFAGTRVAVTTDDARIADHAQSLGVECVITPESCPTGSDRVLAALEILEQSVDGIDIAINLQGDAPFTPVSAITEIIKALRDDAAADVATPVQRLSWKALDDLRAAKVQSPFSGTTAVIDKHGYALWFSKTVIPTTRQENRQEAFSPVYRHAGLYGFRRAALTRFCALPQGRYELAEGLEQLRMLENGMKVRTVLIEGDTIHGGIDSPKDLKRAEALLAS